MYNKLKELGYPDSEINELLKVSKNIEADYLKLLENYPIQYLIGYVNFYGYKINVNKNVLIPRYETECLVEKTIKYIKEIFDGKVDILDICTGSGNIAIALNKEVNSNVDASDISEDALLLAKENSQINNANVNFIKSDIFENIKNKYDVIISNPPYIDFNEEIMDSVKKYEPHLALYAKDKGLYFYKEILKKSREHLNSKFIIAFEIGYNQGNQIESIVSDYFRNVKINLEKDLSGRDRYIFILSE